MRILQLYSTNTFMNLLANCQHDWYN